MVRPRSYDPPGWVRPERLPDDLPPQEQWVRMGWQVMGAPAKHPPQLATAKPDENALPPLVRPRSLSTDVTRLLRSIGETFEKAPALKAPEKAGGKLASLGADEEPRSAQAQPDAASN